MKDMGEARYVLSMKIIRDRPKKLIYMHQEAYIKRVLECLPIHCSKPIDTLVKKDLTLSLDKCRKIDDEK